MSLEYGASYLAQNEAALCELEKGMTPAAVAFAREMAAQMQAEEEAEDRRKTVYFAHPISDYGTPWESAAETAISLALPGFDLVNPNRPDFDAGYRAEGMQFFMDRARECDALVAAPFPDGNYGAGVGKESFAAMMARRPIYLLDRVTLAIAPGIVGPVLPVDQTRRYVAHYRQS